MSITIEQLSKNIQAARQQEAKCRDDAAACAGAIQAYEQLLTQLIQAKRDSDLLQASQPGLIDQPTKKKKKKK